MNKLANVPLSGQFPSKVIFTRWCLDDDLVTIQGVLMARIDRLAEEAKQVLQTAAVLGREFSPRLLAAVWDGRGNLKRHLAELKRLEKGVKGRKARGEGKATKRNSGLCALSHNER